MQDGAKPPTCLMNCMSANDFPRLAVETFIENLDHTTGLPKELRVYFKISAKIWAELPACLLNFMSFINIFRTSSQIFQLKFGQPQAHI